MVLFVLRDLEDLIENMDYAKIVLYKIVDISKDRSYVWLRAGCLAFRGEVRRDVVEKVKNKLEDMKKLGKNVIEFEEVIRDDQFYLG